jgi:hypothetical protein
MSELLVIAVPGGSARAGGLPVGLVFVPRLADRGEDLAAYGMDRWPDLLRTIGFELELRRVGGAVEVLPVSPRLPDPAAALAAWRAMFPPGAADGFRARVRSAARRDPSLIGVDVLPTTEEAADLRQLYAREVAGLPWGAELEGVTARAGGRRGRAADRARRGAPGRLEADGARPGFHEVVAHLREHPQVLRRLGLIVDLEVALPADLAAVRAALTLPPWPVGPPPDVRRPWTRCVVTGGRVLPEAPPESDLADGLLRLGGAGPVPDSGNPRWSVVGFDVEAAVVRLPRPGQADPVLPGLRSAGLGLLRTERGGDILRRAGLATGRGAVDGAELGADDVLLGLRLDVRDPDSGGWRSLHQRRAVYTVDGTPLGPPDGWIEEGQVKRDALVDAGGGLEGDELVARWDGWSLAVPLPAPHPGERRASPTALDWHFTAVPPLPRLRFGRSYRLRARAADLAGTGLTVADLADGPAAEVTELLPYGRVEPVPAPLVVAAGPVGPGAGPERLVVRSAGGPPPPPLAPPDEFPLEIVDILADSPTVPADPDDFVAVPVGPPPPPPPEPDRRILLAPPVSLELAEQHGLFDPIADADAAWALARRAVPSVTSDDAHAAATASGVPWLPDPMAARWVVRPDPRSGLAPVSGTWAPPPDGEPLGHAPVGLELRGGPVAAIGVEGSTVVVTLPRGAELDVAVSSAPLRDDVAALALPAWSRETTVDEIRAAVLDGRHGHITPARVVRLVHAVQRPLEAPDPIRFSASRALGDTGVVVAAETGVVFLDRSTTGRLALIARWREPAESGPAPVSFADVGAQPVEPGSGPHRWTPLRHELGDTRRRSIAYALVAAGRWADGFPPGTDIAVEGPARQLEVPSSARPAAPALRDVTPAFARDSPGASSGWTRLTRRRRGGLVRLRMAPGWWSSGIGEQLAVVLAKDGFPPEAARPWLTEAGRDPLVDVAAPLHWPTPGQVVGPATEVWLEEAGLMVQAVGVDPRRDPATGEWLADVDLGPLTLSSDRPFVRLALARLQPLSLSRLHLSPVVRPAPFQLLAQRDLEIRRDGTRMTVTLAGIASDRGNLEPGTLIETWVERWTGPPGPATTTFTDLDGQPGAWLRLPGEPAVTVLNTAVELPDPRATAAAGDLHRLVIREWENLPSQAAVMLVPTSELGRRVVFADLVAL